MNVIFEKFEFLKFFFELSIFDRKFEFELEKLTNFNQIKL